MSAITTHVLDTARGRPAAGIEVILEQRSGDETWSEAGRDVTDADGRARDLMKVPLTAGVYRLTFETAPYHAAQGITGFYSNVVVTFEVRNAGQHYHVPLLLSPYGYSTYRGS